MKIQFVRLSVCLSVIESVMLPFSMVMPYKCSLMCHDAIFILIATLIPSDKKGDGFVSRSKQGQETLKVGPTAAISDARAKFFHNNFS